MSEKRLENRIALVTGASRGLGRAMALELAKEGAHIVALARTAGALEELDDEVRRIGAPITILRLDLRAADKIDQIGPALYQRWQKIDILVGVAGILGPLSPLPHVTADAWDVVLDINLTANWRLIRTLDPLLRGSDAARVLFTTAGEADGLSPYWGPYAIAKAGLEALAKTYAEETINTNIRVNLLDPGPMKTGLRAKAFPGENKAHLTDPTAVAARAVDLLLPSFEKTGGRFTYRELASAA